MGRLHKDATLLRPGAGSEKTDCANVRTLALVRGNGGGKASSSPGLITLVSAWFIGPRPLKQSSSGFSFQGASLWISSDLRCLAVKGTCLCPWPAGNAWIYGWWSWGW